MTASNHHHRPRVWALVVLAAILAITGIESYALYQGIDGVALSTSIAALAAIAGATARHLIGK